MLISNLFNYRATNESRGEETDTITVEPESNPDHSLIDHQYTVTKGEDVKKTLKDLLSK